MVDEYLARFLCLVRVEYVVYFDGELRIVKA